jgi:Cof subfamily protein (haloacid dehalogenase superfamily)
VSSRRPKLIATDLDGTIVPHVNPISKRTINAFNRAHELGVEIFFVTGRPTRWMGEISETFSMGSAICCNGGIIYDLRSEKVLEEFPIPQKDLFTAVDELRRVVPSVTFALETHDRFHREKAYVPKWDIGQDNVGVQSIEDLFDKKILKLLARVDESLMSADELLAIAQPLLKGVLTVTHSAGSASLLEMSAVGISKGETLAMMAARMGIDAKDCVSFGDNPNDFSMFEWCARSYAMEDGHPDGRKYAKFVAPPCDDDGVAQIIEELLDLPA